MPKWLKITLIAVVAFIVVMVIVINTSPRAKEGFQKGFEQGQSIGK